MTKFTWSVPPEAIPEERFTFTEKADIVIIGAGHAGTCAAREAAEQGASVLVAEQQDDGHQRILGIGEMGYMNSRWQLSRGIPAVDVDRFMTDWQLRTNNRANYRLIRTYAEKCGDCFDWFLEPLSEEEKNSIHPMMTPRSPDMIPSQDHILSWTGTPNMGMALMRRAVKENQRLAREHGAKFFFGARAEQLLLEGGRVTGAAVRLEDGRYGRLLAERGVVLAAGDYSKNARMCRDLLAETADLVDEGDFTGHGWDGSGIQMGVWAGGRLEPRSHAAAGGNYSFPGFDTIGSTACLRVNTHGNRYSNEGFGNHVLAALAGARQPNGMLWSIFDSNILDEVKIQAACNASFDYTDPERVKDLTDLMEEAEKNRGKMIMHRDPAGDKRPFCCAETVEELAAALFEDPADRENLVRSVARYNELCARGEDTDFGKEPALLHPVIRPPFYASGQYKDSCRPFGQSMKILVTVSGLLTDEHQNVLDKDFEPLPGLFATGNCCGGRFGLQYSTSIPGQSISMAQTLGREVGRYLAAEAAAMKRDPDQG